MVSCQYASRCILMLHLTCSIVCCILPCRASLNRTCIILVCASCHVDVFVVYYVVCFFLVCFFGLFPTTSRLWGTVRLRPFVFFMDSFFFLVGFKSRWSYPRNHYYLCYASLLALAMPMLRCLPFACQPPNCHVKPLTHHVLANHWLAMLPLAQPLL